MRLACLVIIERPRRKQCERVPDALAWSTTKGKVGEMETTSSTFRGKAFRIEHIRVLPKCWMPMRRVRAQQNRTLCGNSIVSDFVAGQCLTAHTKRRRVEAERFL